MIVDREGTLWVGIGTRLRFLRRGSTRFEDAGVSASVKRLAQSTESALWIVERDRYLVPLRGPKEVGLGWSPEDILFDRDDTLLDHRFAERPETNAISGAGGEGADQGRRSDP